jgi:alanine-glyoxylate transaminase/serine-glyoxylate transaminase/serine-pyruvate transaminase
MTQRLLLGPGPSNTPQQVLAALGRPTIGHLDPEFLNIMDGVQSSLRTLFRTENPMTIPVSGTGSAGMEALLVNLIERGDRIVIAVNGVFGGRAADLASRLGAEVACVQFPWGQPVDPDEIRASLALAPTKALFFVHAETSTGVLSNAEALARVAREAGALCLMDCVTSLAGCPVEIDAWGVDAAFSGTQKCLSVPPGLTPVTLGKRAVEALERRRHPVQSWYLDLTMVGNYWGEQRTYHHTAPINMIYALEAGLQLALDEGLEQRFMRHRQAHEALVSGLATMGLELLPPEGSRLPMLNAIRIPDGVDEQLVRSRLLREHNIEVGAGLGELQGRIMRVGLMGHNATRDNVDRFLGALSTCLDGAA